MYNLFFLYANALWVVQYMNFEYGTSVLGSCASVSAPFRPLRVKVSPENDTNASSQQDKENTLAIFLKMLRSKIMASFAHFVGVRRSCRTVQFILTATKAAIATEKA